MSQQPIAVTVPPGWVAAFAVAGAGIGAASAFVIGPLVSWLIGLLGDAPGPLRLAAELPLLWAIPVLTVLGLGIGLWISAEWKKEVGVVTVADDGVQADQAAHRRRVAKERVTEVSTDGRDLVVLGASAAEELRVKTDDALHGRLADAFRQFDYPWLGTTDPREADFVDWVDGAGRLGEEVDALLRARHRALSDKRPGAADEARDRLRELGVAVRDRKSGQQVRGAPAGSAEG